MVVAAKSKKVETIDTDIVQVKREQIVFRVLGTTPVILNRLSQKAQHQLLLPGAPKNRAEKASSLKHDPYAEFRASPYRLKGDDRPTELAIPCVSFKKALADAALDIPGAAKSQIGRLVYVEGDYTPLYGVPMLKMDIVRSADINRTPDVRTRACVRNWACEIVITYAVPLVTRKQIYGLLSAAGMIRGVGDWRPQKGSGDFGQFDLVDGDDPRWAAIVAQGGRDAQLAALANPTPYDSEAEELLSWFDEEVERRDMTKNLQGADAFVYDEEEEAPATNGHLAMAGV